MKKHLFYYMSFYVFAACTPKEKEIPKDILPVNKMKLIVWDMTEAGAYAEYAKEKRKDTTVKTLNTASLALVLKLHNITKEDFETQRKGRSFKILFQVFKFLHFICKIRWWARAKLIT